MAIPAIVQAGVSLYQMLQNDKPQTTTSTTKSDYWENPYVQRALKRMDLVSQRGYDPEILKRLTQSTSLRYGQEASGLRTTASQNFQRQNVPIQVQQQLMADLSAKLAGQRMGAMSNIDIQNEQVKMQALQALLGAGEAGKGDL